MNLDQISFHVTAYKESNQILDAAYYLIRNFGLSHDNLEGLDFQEDVPEGMLLLTAVGNVPGKQMVNIPKNIFDYDLSLALNLIAHEMLHVKQKDPNSLVEDKNEREFQAYYEMLFHVNFPKIPDAPDFNRKQFCSKALEYYRRMGENTALQQKYASQKLEIEELLENLS